MRENPRPTVRVQLGGPSGLDDPFAGGDGTAADTMAVVSSGVHAETLPVANMAVGEVRTRYRDRFDIDPHSQALLDGTEAGDEMRIRPGQTLTFVRRAGEKGAGAEERPR